MRKYHKILINSLLISLCALFCSFLGSKFLGNPTVFQGTRSEPLSWNEAIDQIPRDILLSVACGIIGFYLLYNEEKNRNKNQ